ncbi:MAG: primosomal protein N', partial [Coprobacillus sp.]|nr:primosomal protein N' [Coprobacillus sp.]
MPFDGGGQAYTYTVPSELEGEVDVGSLVRIPLGKRHAYGIIWEKNVVPKKEIIKKLRPISGLRYDAPVLAPDEIKLCEWISKYYVAPLNSVLQAVLPSAVRQGVRPILDKKISIAHKLSEEEFSKLQKKASKQAELYSELSTNGETSRGVLKFSASVINSLIKSGIAKETATKVSRVANDADDSPAPTLNLTDEQTVALDSIKQSIAKGKYQTHLLHGATGSGKTEVYIGAIREILSLGGSAIFLVPEVALTQQTVDRLRRGLSGCGTQVVVWHNKLSAGERFDAWMDMIHGKARVLVGARSGIFAPLKNLRLIVVDEEHETSFKQSETPFYHGRDVAVFRASLCGAVCVLGSATPSLESFYNAQVGKYQLNRMPKRIDDRPLPMMRIIDMRREILRMQGQTTFSRPLLDAISDRLQGHEQCILFLNRRGYSRALICPTCGHVLSCPHCSSPLTYHRTDQTMLCHLCGHAESVPTRCPECGEEDLRKRGFGTQRAEELLAKFFPDAKIVRLDADAMSKKNEFKKILSDFREGKIDILLGTQMIAKGLDFPRVTLAALIDADVSLHVPDFRAAERTFQLLVQVAGRAGRGQLDGEVIVQTFTPYADPIQFAKRAEFEDFLEAELKRRKEFGYPPHRHIIRHIFRGRDERRVEKTAERWAEFLEQHAHGLFEIRGPAPCPTGKLQDNFRFHIWYFC